MSTTATVPPPLIASRTRLYIGDIDRSWAYLYTYGGDFASQWKAAGQTYNPSLMPVAQTWYDPLSHGRFDLPLGVVAGPLLLDTGRPAAGQTTFAVLNMPARRPLTITAGTSAETIQAIVNGSPIPVALTMQPGLYSWDKTITLPAGSWVSGYHATIRRLPMNNIGTNWPTFYVTGADVSIYGLTFQHDEPGMVFMANPPESGLVVTNCRFGANSNLGFYFADALVQHCTFDGSGAIIAPAGLYWRCRFLGPSASDPWQFWGPGSAMMLDCLFDKTQRGPVFNAGSGPLNDLLFVGTECHGIVRGNNGNECWLCEGGQLNRLLAFHCRIASCDSPAFQFDGGCSGAYIRDFGMTDGMGLNLDVNAVANPTATISGVTFEDSQFVRCGAWFGPKTSNCTIKNSLFIGYLPTRGNQTFSNVTPIGYSRTICAWSAGQNNMLQNTPVIALPAGFTGSAGFAVSRPDQ